MEVQVLSWAQCSVFREDKGVPRSMEVETILKIVSKPFEQGRREETLPMDVPIL